MSWEAPLGEFDLDLLFVAAVLTELEALCAMVELVLCLAGDLESDLDLLAALTILLWDLSVEEVLTAL